jgi:hypothetical protein
MPAPAPYDGVSGAVQDPAESEALNLYRQYAWLYRWSNEMNTDADLDLKKLAQFAFHCRKYRMWYDALVARGVPARAVIEGAFAFKKATWPTRAAMLQDLQAIYDGAGTIYDWIKVNATEARRYTTVTFDANFEVQSDEPIKVAKPPALATRVGAFRALFA